MEVHLEGGGVTQIKLSGKHLALRIEQLLVLSRASNCPRRKLAAMVIDPVRNVVLADAYNGAPRGAGELCGGSVCLRDTQQVESGTRVEVGCHHAEMNVLCNCCSAGVSTSGAWLIVTGEPCLMCAKLIHHAGIERVIAVGGGYAGANGVDYLRANGVKVELVEGPKDPRGGGGDESAPLVRVGVERSGLGDDDPARWQKGEE